MTLLPAFHFKPVTAAEMRRRDAAAMERGLSEEVLMENAGHALAEGTLLFPHRGALVVCGGGNNGGDGLVAARWLIKAGRRVTVLLWRKPENYQNAARAHWRALSACRPTVRIWSPRLRLPDRGEPVVDAFLGLGVRPPLSEEARTLIRWMNARRGPKIAADVPSGWTPTGAAPPGGRAGPIDRDPGASQERACFVPGAALRGEVGGG
ncbi:MAG: NAD(P)H-hydrate epimerase [Elusimicrobia bacterium]|nr:NAD(P)H-hydrate epimerase [Elusimicrobiota bacterium]